MPLIDVEGLVKEFSVFDRREGVLGAVGDLFHRRRRPLRAVDGVSFAIDQGEIVGYIGPNGAGKSTTIKMLTGILVPTSGRLVVDGLVPHRDRRTFTRRIGVVFGQRTQLWWDIAVVESFRLLAKIYGVPRDALEAQLDRLDAILGLRPLLRTPVRKLSLGQRMRCDLAASLLHDPPLLFLDEPTIGLDVVAKDSVRTFLRELNQELSTTILLTTHDLRDIEELCRRVIVIDHGRILFDGPLTEMKARHAGTVHVEVDRAAEVDRERVR
ncbi:MAG: ATP-binding cassette domain-containing protein, partial [Planctomycetota bacterium JB042]